MSVISLDWRENVACAGRGDLFFGPQDEKPLARVNREAEAKAVCATCPSRQPCQEFALSLGIPYGVFGGLGEDDRRGKPRAYPPVCRNGLHVMDAANTYTDRRGWDICRACRRAADRLYRQRRREQGQEQQLRKVA